MEILTGASERRRWSAAIKAQLVAGSLEPGVVVTELARTHGARASQLHLWRKDARAGRLVLPAPPAAFAEVVIVPAPPAAAPARRTPPKASAASIEIDAPTLAIRIRDGVDADVVAAIVLALKP